MQPRDKVLVPHPGIHLTISLSCFADTETPTRWKKLTVCCPQHIDPRGFGARSWLPITSPPTNQKNVDELIHISQPLSFTLSLKTFPWTSWENSGLLNSSCLDSSLSTCKKCCTLVHRDPESVDGLYWVDPIKLQSQICIGTTTVFPFPEVRKVAALRVHMKLFSSFKKDLNTTNTI